jgi:hypothetical protein
MSKHKMVSSLFSAPSKYTAHATEGKSRKSMAHRYERRRVKESLRKSFFEEDLEAA